MLEGALKERQSSAKFIRNHEASDISSRQKFRAHKPLQTVDLPAPLTRQEDKKLKRREALSNLIPGKKCSKSPSSRLTTGRIFQTHLTMGSLYHIIISIVIFN